MPKDLSSPSIIHLNKTGSRILNVRSSDTMTSSSAIRPPAKRICLGGRGREWAAESLKLLETMSEMKDAKIFLEPMDPLKYADYYTMISDPLDLSKIMLKFHGGSYPSLQQFTKDMRDMFDNYKAYFADNESEVHKQVWRLSDWFESEIERISHKWYRLCMNSLPATHSNYSSSVSSTWRPIQPRIGSLEARIQAIEADNQRIVGMCTGGPSFSTPKSTSNLSTTVQPRSQPPIYAIRLPGTGRQSSASSVSSSVRSSGSVYLVTKPSSNGLSSTATSGSSTCAGSSRSYTIPSSLQSSQTPILASAKMVLMVEVTNVWFGAARCKPCQPVVISEQGIKLVFKDGDDSVDFMIDADEIVRCAAYFGNARKHTLFVFVVPNCTRRLPPSISDRQFLSTLVVIFLPALGQRQIADLVYIFWRISHTSMFGLSGGLLTEIDQKAALSLLSNIKPTILSTVAERMRDIAGTDFLPTLGSGDAASSVTQHIAVPVAQNGLAGQSDADQCVESDAKQTRHTHSSVGLRTSKRRLSVTHDLIDEDAVDDDDEEWSTAVARKRKHLRIKLTRNRPRVVRCRQKETAGRVRNEVEIVEPEESVCKTEVVDDEYELGLDQPLGADDGSHLDLSTVESSEPFTIIEQWETDGDIAAAADDAILDEDYAPGSPVDVENDLEIVLPTEADDVDVDSSSICNEAESQEDSVDDDLVLTRKNVNIRCPVTQKVMQHPMKNKRCGHCYDRRGIEDLISHRGTKARCPVPGCSNNSTLCMKDLEPEDSLQQYIQTKVPMLSSSSAAAAK